MVNTMTYDEKLNIVLALRTIKEKCKENDGRCVECPFYVTPAATCGIMDLCPENWNIDDLKSEPIWRALS